MGQTHAAETKEKVVAEAMERRKTYKQIGDENGGIHPTTIVRWVREAKQEKSQKKTIGRKQAARSADRDLEAENIFLLAEIGRLNLEIDHLRKLVCTLSIVSESVEEKATDSKIPAVRFGLPFQRKSKV